MNLRLGKLSLSLAFVALFAGGCAGNDPKETMATARGLSTEVKGAVGLKKPLSPDREAGFLKSLDERVASLLEEHRNEILAGGIARYDQSKKEGQTEITAKNVEMEVESFVTQAEENSATRQVPEGRVTRFRFTLRKDKAKVFQDPPRVEVAVNFVENSRAPADTIAFPQDVRAELLDSLNKVVFELAQKSELDPIPPRPAPIR